MNTNYVGYVSVMTPEEVQSYREEKQLTIILKLHKFFDFQYTWDFIRDGEYGEFRTVGEGEEYLHIGTRYGNFSYKLRGAIPNDIVIDVVEYLQFEGIMKRGSLNEIRR